MVEIPSSLPASYDGNDRLVWRFEYAGGRMPVAMTDRGGTKYYLHYDQVGSLRAVSDTHGNVVKEVTYDTFGNILFDSNPSFGVPCGFAGGLYDPLTKLTHFGFREYDSFTGKWTAEDPIGFAGGDSNLYGYVLNDPVNWVDPLGRNSFDPLTGMPKNIIQPICDLFDGIFGDKPTAPPGTFDKISDGLCEDVPQALKGFSNGLECLNSLDKSKMTPLQHGLYDYLYININRSLNESESPINLIDKMDTYNDIRSLKYK